MSTPQADPEVGSAPLWRSVISHRRLLLKQPPPRSLSLFSFHLQPWSIVLHVAQAYKRSSVCSHVEAMQGKLMLVHGLIDENVHFRHTARLVGRQRSSGCGEQAWFSGFASLSCFSSLFRTFPNLPPFSNSLLCRSTR